LGYNLKISDEDARNGPKYEYTSLEMMRVFTTVTAEAATATLPNKDTLVMCKKAKIGYEGEMDDDAYSYYYDDDYDDDDYDDDDYDDDDGYYGGGGFDDAVNGSAGGGDNDYSYGDYHFTNCTDSDDGATDPYGDGCDEYTVYPAWCGGYDDSDFTSYDMCCACEHCTDGADCNGDDYYYYYNGPAYGGNGSGASAYGSGDDATPDPEVVTTLPPTITPRPTPAPTRPTPAPTISSQPTVTSSPTITPRPTSPKEWCPKFNKREVTAAALVEFEVSPVDIDGLPIHDASLFFTATLGAPHPIEYEYTPAGATEPLNEVEANVTMCSVRTSMTPELYAYRNDDKYAYDTDTPLGFGTRFKGKCQLPSHYNAIPWIGENFVLDVKIGNDVLIGRETFDVMECPKGYYEPNATARERYELDDDAPPTQCINCDDIKGIKAGMISCPAGTTVETIKVKEGYWRAHKRSIIFLECPW
jgi:hypothetical protein